MRKAVDFADAVERLGYENSSSTNEVDWDRLMSAVFDMLRVTLGDVFMLSIASSSMARIRANEPSTNLGSTFTPGPMSAIPAATAISVAVRVFPPNTRASSVKRYPTESGPTVTVASFSRINDPPPRPILSCQLSCNDCLTCSCAALRN